MRPSSNNTLIHMLAGAGALLIAASTFSQDAPIKLDVDATDAPRKILHARLRIPAQPGKLTLLYPKWIPGEHAPTGRSPTSSASK